MTFNIWNYQSRWRDRRELIAGLILAHNPDAVALQETRHDFRYERGKGQGEQLAEMTGYLAFSHTAQVYIPIPRVDEGLTILTRQPPRHTAVRRLTLLPRERRDENHRICLCATLPAGSRELHVFDTHFSLSARARQTNAVEVARFVAEQSGSHPAVLMGDLNAEPDSLPVRFLLGDQSIDGERGDFVDCWVAAHPGDVGFTYASWGPFQRIDYVLGRNLGGMALQAQIVGDEASDGVFPSDHMGIVVDLDME